MSSAIVKWCVLLVLALLVLSCSVRGVVPGAYPKVAPERGPQMYEVNGIQVDPDIKRRWWRENWVPMPCTRDHKVVEVADLRDMSENPALYKGNCMVVADRMDHLEGFPVLMRLCSGGQCIYAKFIGPPRGWIFEEPAGETCVVAYGWWHQDGLGGWNLGTFGMAFC